MWVRIPPPARIEVASIATSFSSFISGASVEIDVSKRRLVLSVGELTRQVADSNRSPHGPSLSLRGRLGGAAHRTYQQAHRNSGSYRQEVHLDVSYSRTIADAGDWNVRIRGRLDGLIEEIDRAVIEEIKTVALTKASFSALQLDDYPRHRRQVDIYLYLLTFARPEHPCAGRLVYINLTDGKQRSFEIAYRPDDVEPVVNEVVAELILREIRRSHEAALKRKIAPKISFPFSDLRTGQDEIISAVSTCLRGKKHLVLEAPTGLGKTVAVLHAAVQYALENDKQVMFLTSKTTQQDLVFETALHIKAGNTFPRILLLRAKQKLCPLDEPRCGAGDCPYIEDFQRRFRCCHRIQNFLNEGVIHPDRLAELGERDKLCPVEAQLALCEDADLIIGDYNYAFDPGCRLLSLFEDRDPSRLILIVDEAHNLPDRARSYYSAALLRDEVQQAVANQEAEIIKDFNRALEAIQSQFEYYLNEAPETPDPYPIQLSPSSWDKIAADFEEAVVPYWYRLTAEESGTDEDPILALQRTLESFSRAVNFNGENFAHLLRRNPTPALEVLCLDAGPFLKETFECLHSSVCMSATLQPFESTKSLLGMGKNVQFLALQSSFPFEYCRLVIDPSVTTLYRERDENVDPIALKIDLFCALLNRKALAFFPSFDLMKRIVANLKTPSIFLQEEGMSDGARLNLLRSFKRCRRGLLCSVMGGVFAEGIDLPGELAEAAVIVGVGLPQICTENEMIRAYYDRLGENGFEYAYLYPGMRRVIQSVGRIIRSETDRGLILLLDRRYASEHYQRFFPHHWYDKSPAELICEDWEGIVRDSKRLFSVKV